MSGFKWRLPNYTIPMAFTAGTRQLIQTRGNYLGPFIGASQKGSTGGLD